MELGNQIRIHRKKLDISQEKLAEMVYVSRQSISNWENNKTYPDVNSLIRLSEVFSISLDILMKGDLEKMKKEINAKDQKVFKKYSTILAGLLILLVITPAPLLYFLDEIGIGVWVFIALITIYMSFLVEKKKKKYDIYTYREIIAFSEGENLDDILKAREEGKHKYQKLLIAMVLMAITLVFSMIFRFLLTKLF